MQLKLLVLLLMLSPICYGQAVHFYDDYDEEYEYGDYEEIDHCNFYETDHAGTTVPRS